MHADQPPPIVFFHRGYDPYIAFALQQARVTNPQSPVYLLGDETNDLSHLGVTHVPYRNYPGRSKEFIAAYQHFSCHELACERLCFERHFHLADFVQRERIGPFLYLDSDVLLLVNLRPLLPTWRQYDIAGTPGMWCSCYYGEPALTSAFCDFMLERYRDPGQLEAWRRQYGVQRLDVSNPGINDMVLSGMFLERSGLRHLHLEQPRDRLVFNTSFLRSEHEHIPIARGPDGRIYALIDGRSVQLGSLHLIGSSKRWASAFVDWSGALVRCFLKPNYRRNFKKLIKHYYFGRRFKRGIPLAPAPK